MISANQSLGINNQTTNDCYVESKVEVYVVIPGHIKLSIF